MKCVVPLAGPDLVHEQHRFRPWTPIDGQTLLARALHMRAWAGDLRPSDYIFVLREVEGLSELEVWLNLEWPGCRVVRVSDLTDGALFSVLAGLALVGSTDEPVIIDLADILFSDGPMDLLASLNAPGVGAVVPCFVSNDPCYSYLRLEDGVVVEAAEKRVISDRASAGVYAFKSVPVFLRAAAHSMDMREQVAHKGALFVCPSINGVLAQGLQVLAPMLDNVEPVGKAFHTVTK